MTRGYASSVDPVTHFGLGEITAVDSIRITWPVKFYQFGFRGRQGIILDVFLFSINNTIIQHNYI